MMYTIVELGDFHCSCNSLVFVLRAASVVYVTKLSVLRKLQRWFQAVWAVLAIDNPLITFATIRSHRDHTVITFSRVPQGRCNDRTNLLKCTQTCLKWYGISLNNMVLNTFHFGDVLRWFSNTCKIAILMYTGKSYKLMCSKFATNSNYLC